MRAKREPHDRGRLDHHRVHRADGAVGLRPGPHHQRAVAAGIRGRRLRRQPARAPAARPGVAVALRAAVQPRVRADDRRARGDRVRGGGSRASGAGSRFGRGRRGRHRGRGPGRDARAGPGLDPGRRGAADAGSAPVPQGHPALGHPAEAERGAAALGPDPERACARGPVSADFRPRGGRAAAEPPHPARPRREGGARQRGAGAGRGLRSGGAGLRVGGGAGGGRHERPRGRGRGRHDREARRRGRARRPGDRVRSPQRRRGAARAGAGAPAAAPAHAGRRRRAGRDPRLSAQRALPGRARPARRDHAR